MQNLVITWRELLVAVTLVLAVYIAEMLLLMRSNRKHGAKKGWSFSGGREQRRETELLWEKLDQLWGEVKELRAMVEQLKSDQSPASSYSRAITMAREGRGASEIASACAIPRGEAELITTLHRTNSHDS
ncbi:MAG TPA: hypothetical protein DEP05_00330 [Betaproteobacteria bacterium]|nr:hypothetical protein [Betaproteobacteria bacterium]